MKGRHVMIDLETLSTSVSAAFTQLGAVGFYPAEPDRPFEELQLHVSIRSNLHIGRTVDPDTLLWWMDDSDKGAGPEARQAFVAGQRSDGVVDVGGALIALYDFCLMGNGRQGMDARREPPAGVWGHGSTFDVSIIEHAYGQTGMKVPWSYRVVRDTRTLLDLTEQEMGYPGEGGHIALIDARHQARRVIEVLEGMRSPT